MTTATAMVHVRVNESIKAQAAQALADMGLSVSDAVRVFLTRVAVEQALPFALKTPNAASRAAIAEGQTIVQSHSARFASVDALVSDLEKNSHQ